MDKHDIFKIIRKHDIDRLKEEISTECDLNVRESTEPFFTPLLDAIDEFDSEAPIELVKILIEAGADVNAWDLERDCNPLIIAMWEEHDDVTCLLLEAGADPNVKDKEGNSPLRWNVKQNNIKIVKQLLDRGAKKTIDKAGGFAGMNALGIAVSCLNIPMIKILLEAGANPEITDYDRRKPIERLPKDADPKIKKQIENLLNYFSQKSLAIADTAS